MQNKLDGIKGPTKMNELIIVSLTDFVQLLQQTSFSFSASGEVAMR